MNEMDNTHWPHCLQFLREVSNITYEEMVVTELNMDRQFCALQMARLSIIPQTQCMV